MQMKFSIRLFQVWGMQIPQRNIKLFPFLLPYMSMLQHAGAVVVPKRTTKAHITVKEGGGAEAMTFGGGEGKGGRHKGVQHLCVYP